MSEAQGLSLADIGGIGEMIDIGRPDGKKLCVTGISTKGCLSLLFRYPDLQRWLSGQTLAVPDIMGQMPEVIAAIIAAGTGQLDDLAAEEGASNLPVEVQMDVVEAVYRKTFKEGFGPFVNRVLGLYAHVVVSPGKDPAMKSPPESKPSSPLDTAPNTSGITPPAK